MGTLKDKLIYIKDTLAILKPTGTLDWVARMSGNSNMTLRERMNFVKSVCGPFRQAAGDPWLDRSKLEKVVITLADGSASERNPDIDTCIVFPPFKLYTGMEIQLPIYRRDVNWRDTHVDLSALQSSKNQPVKMRTANYGLNSLILNDHQALPDNTISGHCETWFGHGLRFGKNVYNCSSKWINGMATAKPTNLFVAVPEGFEGTVYLSMLDISAECLVGIINNLADMSETTTVYTLGLGSANIAKLTEEQLAIAEEKGWIVT